MKKINIHNTINDIVALQPTTADIFEKLGIDHCCGGNVTLAHTCQEKGMDPESVLTMLRLDTKSGEGRDVDVALLGLGELADHIEQVHHAYLWEELPRLYALTEKVSIVHGGTDPRLIELHILFNELFQEMKLHMQKEEQVLFPMIRELEREDNLPYFHCGSVSNPIRQMESEHQSADAALRRLRKLTDDFAPPSWACGSYRAMLSGLERFDKDMQAHMKKENVILFKRAIALEKLKIPPN